MSDTLNPNQGRIKQIIAHSNRITNLETSIKHREHLIEEQKRFITEERRKIESERAKRDNVEAELLALLAGPEPETTPARVEYASLDDPGVTPGWYQVGVEPRPGDITFEVTDSGATRRHWFENGEPTADAWTSRSLFSAGPFIKVTKPEWVR